MAEKQKEILKDARLRLAPKEKSWLARIDTGLCEMPPSEEELLREFPPADAGYDPASYGL